MVFIGLLSRAFYLQIILGDTYRQAAEENRYRVHILRAPRGVIYDKNGNLLVRNIPSLDVVAVPTDLPKSEEERKKIWEELQKIIDLTRSDLEKSIDKIDYSSYQPVLIKENISREQALILETKIRNLPGIKIEKNPIREYLSPERFAHILGYIGKISKEELKERDKENYQITDFIGKEGLELVYEEVLRGTKGKEQVEVDSFGNIKKIVAKEEPMTGKNLILTIDSELQAKALEILKKGAKGAHSNRAACVILNPQNGEILALISLPSYNNNFFSKGFSDQDYNLLMNDPDKPLYNRAISGLYPPGSTIKPIMAAAGLEEGIITPNTVINDTGSIDVPHKYDPNIVYHFVGWERSGLGPMNLFSAIAKSSDIYFYYVGGGFKDFSGLGVEKIIYYFKKFNLGTKLGIDLPAEAEGLVPSPEWKQAVKGEEWYLGDTYHISIGQGDLLSTPLQVASWTATIANGGTIFRPYIVKKIVEANNKVIQEKKPYIIREGFIHKEKLELVRQGMRETVISGSAKDLMRLSWAVAGKTGTAQHSENKKTHAWFTAFAPYEDPEIVVTVLIEEGGEGSRVAVPIVGEILEWYFNHKPR